MTRALLAGGFVDAADWPTDDAERDELAAYQRRHFPGGAGPDASDAMAELAGPVVAGLPEGDALDALAQRRWPGMAR